MAVSRTQKTGILEELQLSAASQPTVVLLTTKDAEQGLTASSNSELRQTARKGGVKLQVVKNTLIRRVFSSVPELTGSTLLAYMVNSSSVDEVTVPKAIVDLVTDTYGKQISVLGSVVNGEFYNSTQTIQLSKVPSFNDSMAMVAGTLNAITAKIARSVKEVPSGIARGVSAYSEKIS